MSPLLYIRQSYNVPAFRGRRVRFTWPTVRGHDALEGTIVLGRGGRLGVRFDGETRLIFVHPTWRIEYLSWDKGTTVYLNGIEVEDCIGFNVQRGFIERLARDEWGGYLWTGPRFNPCHAIERVYGLVHVISISDIEVSHFAKYTNNFLPTEEEI